MRIESRFYREIMNGTRFRSFVVGYKDTDLWIGVDSRSYSPAMELFALELIKELRTDLERLILKHPLFASSFEPIPMILNSSALATEMIQATEKAGTGPMAAVAGAFAEFIGRALIDQFQVNEVVVENGGDLFLKLLKPLMLSVYAGESPLSGKIGIEIPAEDSPLGVCTSAGTVGPSISFGNADAVMVVCKNTAEADAYATAFGNKVKTHADISQQLDKMKSIDSILSMIIVCDGQVGIQGNYPLKLIR